LSPWCQYLMPQRWINRLAGFLANHENPWLKNRLIRYFLNRHAVNLAEAELSDPRQYRSFNHFFTRALKEGVRPLAAGEQTILSPVDGVVSLAAAIDTQPSLQAKGHRYRLIDLLGGDAQDVAAFSGGTFLNVYLAPKDYHRVHMPLSGDLRKMVYVPGKLFSVNPVTCQEIPALFARNERLVAFFDTAIGPMAMVLVGAMIVGRIEAVWAGDTSPQRSDGLGIQVVTYEQPVHLKRGEEMGRFQLGSTVIVLFPKGGVTWDPQLREGASIKMGARIAERVMS
jgi:phosphatidylserine decarboxylase